MPYKIETDHLKLPRKLDRRVKLTKEDRIEILNLINTTTLSDIQIGNQFNVHRKTIWGIRNPEKLLLEKEQYKIRRSDGRYYKKDKHTQSMNKTRLHRKNNINLLIK